MSPRPKVEHLRKPQIISAAAEVLYERGLFDTRIGDIAERAGTSAPTILYYFESKDRLLEEAVDQTDRDFYERLTEGQAQREGAVDKLVHLIEETSLGPGGLSDWTLWMEMWVRARRDPAVRDAYFRLDRRQRKLIADIVREGQAGGRVRPGRRPRRVRAGAQRADGRARRTGHAGSTRRDRRADGRPLPDARIERAWLRPARAKECPCIHVRVGWATGPASCSARRSGALPPRAAGRRRRARARRIAGRL